mgnify:FL=1
MAVSSLQQKTKKFIKDLKKKQGPTTTIGGRVTVPTSTIVSFGGGGGITRGSRAVGLLSEQQMNQARAEQIVQAQKEQEVQLKQAEKAQADRRTKELQIAEIRKRDIIVGGERFRPRTTTDSRAIIGRDEQGKPTSLTLETRRGDITIEPQRQEVFLPTTFKAEPERTTKQKLKDRLQKEYLKRRIDLIKIDKAISRATLPTATAIRSSLSKEKSPTALEALGFPTIPSPVRDNTIIRELLGAEIENLARSPVKEGTILVLSAGFGKIVGFGIKGSQYGIRTGAMALERRGFVRGAEFIRTGTRIGGKTLGLGLGAVTTGQIVFNIAKAEDKYSETAGSIAELGAFGFGARSGSKLGTKIFPIEQTVSKPTAKFSAKVTDTKLGQKIDIATRVSLENRRAFDFAEAQVRDLPVEEPISLLKEVSLGIESRVPSRKQTTTTIFQTSGVSGTTSGGRARIRTQRGELRDLRGVKGSIAESDTGLIAQLKIKEFNKQITQDIPIGIGSKSMSKFIKIDSKIVTAKGGGISFQIGEDRALLGSIAKPQVRGELGLEGISPKLRFKDVRMFGRISRGKFPEGSKKLFQRARIPKKSLGGLALIRLRQGQLAKGVGKLFPKSKKAEIGMSGQGLQLQEPPTFQIVPLKPTSKLKPISKAQQRRIDSTVFSKVSSALASREKGLRDLVIKDLDKPISLLGKATRTKAISSTALRPKLSAKLSQQSKQLLGSATKQISQTKLESKTRLAVVPKLRSAVVSKLKIKLTLAQKLRPILPRIKKTRRIIKPPRLPSFKELKTFKLPKIKKKKLKDDFGLSETFIQRQLLLPLPKNLGRLRK